MPSPAPPALVSAQVETAEPPAALSSLAPPAPVSNSAPTADLPASLPDHLDAVERDIICRALAKTRFNRTQAADLLGISFRQLRYRMQRLDIREPE
jgi:two-component system response regulator PilR (NtrC family)